MIGRTLLKSEILMSGGLRGTAMLLNGGKGCPYSAAEEFFKNKFVCINVFYSSKLKLMNIEI